MLSGCDNTTYAIPRGPDVCACVLTSWRIEASGGVVREKEGDMDRREDGGMEGERGPGYSLSIIQLVYHSFLHWVGCVGEGSEGEEKGEDSSGS